MVWNYIFTSEDLSLSHALPFVAMLAWTGSLRPYSESQMAERVIHVIGCITEKISVALVYRCLKYCTVKTNDVQNQSNSVWSTQLAVQSTVVYIGFNTWRFRFLRYHPSSNKVYIIPSSLTGLIVTKPCRGVKLFLISDLRNLHFCPQILSWSSIPWDKEGSPWADYTHRCTLSHP